MPTDVPSGLTRHYVEERDVRWKAFLKREYMNAALSDLGQVLEDLRKFLVPLTTPSQLEMGMMCSFVQEDHLFEVGFMMALQRGSSWMGTQSKKISNPGIYNTVAHQ